MSEVPYVLFHLPSNQIKGVNDRPVSETVAIELVDVLKSIGIDNKWGGDFTAFGDKLWNPDTAAKDPELAFRYAYHVLGKPFPEGESAIATDSGISYMYARDVLDGPFPAGEPAIASDAEWAYKYAYYILQGPFSAGEPAIYGSSTFKRKYNKILDDYFRR